MKAGTQAACRRRKPAGDRKDQAQPGGSTKAGSSEDSSLGFAGRCLVRRRYGHPESARGRKASGVFVCGGKFGESEVAPVSAVRTNRPPTTRAEQKQKSRNGAASDAL